MDLVRLLPAQPDPVALNIDVETKNRFKLMC